MAEDTIMLDQDMDIDNDAPPAPSTDSTPTATPRSTLRSRRELTNVNDKRGKQIMLTHTRSAIQKYSSTQNTNRDKDLGYKEQRRQLKFMKRNRKLRLQRAITSRTFEVRPLGDGRPSFAEEDDELPERIQRLNTDILTKALHEAHPGLYFNDNLPPQFTEADMADLVQSVEEWQVGCARNGAVMLADKADRLLWGYASDVLTVVLWRPKKLGCEIGEDQFWELASAFYLRVKRVRWLTAKCMKLLEPDELESYRLWGYVSFRLHAHVVLDAIENPGNHPQLDKALAEAYKDEPTFVALQPSTLRSLIGHFEAARSSYLANLNSVLVTGNQNNSVAHNPSQGFGMPSRNKDQYDSSDDEDGGAQGGTDDGGVEDNAQLEEDVTSTSSRLFLKNIDRWMKKKNGKPQGGVDVDKIKALDLSDIKWGI